MTLQWKKRPVEGLFGRARSRSIRGRGISHRDHLLDFENFSKFPVGRDTRRSGSLSTGRSRMTRRWRIFQRNHLLDFVKISKYFKVRSGKRFAHRGLVLMLGPNGLADRGFFPSDCREHSPGLGIFYRDRLFREEVTLQWKKRPVEGLFGRARSRSIRGRGSLWSRSVEKHLRTRDLPVKSPFGL